MFAATFALVPALALAESEPVAQPLNRSNETRSDPTAGKALSEQLGWELAAADAGVRIERIVKNSPVALAHLEEKDLIRKVAGENVLTPERIGEVLDKVLTQGETKTEVVILRDGEELSYLLSLDSITSVPGTASSRTTRANQQDLVAMIEQLQRECQQQRALLESVLAEVQALRTRLGAAPNVRSGQTQAVGTQYTGDIVTPLGQGLPQAAPATAPPGREGASGAPP
jgi:hypothetical protein